MSIKHVKEQPSQVVEGNIKAIKKAKQRFQPRQLAADWLKKADMCPEALRLNS